MVRRRLLTALGLFALLAAGGLGGGYVWIDSAARAPLVAADGVLVVPRGASASRIPRLLADAQLADESGLWAARLWLRLHPVAPKFGKHRLTQGMSLVDVLAALEQPPLPDDAPVVILEGWRISDTDRAFSSGPTPIMPAGAYARAARQPARFKLSFAFSAPTLEGYLYPETYLMPAQRVDPEQLIQRQLDTFDERFARPYAEEIKTSGRTLHELVIVASMLEREEPNPEHRPTIAGIIYKRLERGFPLGIDATSRYELDDWNDRAKFLVRLRDPGDLYNTRLRQGLPPGPIGSPNVRSLVAALRPVPSEYLYYLHDKERNLRLARNADEHEENRRRYGVY